MIWHLNNTTIRNPNRLRSWLLAYSKYGYIPGIFQRGDTKSQIELFDALDEDSAVNSEAKSDEKKSWYGRKIRLALKEFGLIAPPNSSSYLPGEITKCGKSLIKANSDIEIQDIYQRIIYNLETRKKGYLHTFRPIPLLIKILQELESIDSAPFISRNEFALTIQDYKPHYEPRDYANDIAKLRQGVKRNKGAVKKYYNEKFLDLTKSQVSHKIKLSSIKVDYPDVTMRVIQLSKIFIAKGNGIKINPQYYKLVTILSNDDSVCDNETSYYEKLNNIPPLPFDKSKPLLLEIIKDNHTYLINNAIVEKESLAQPNINLSIEELKILRLKQDEAIQKVNETQFSIEQRKKTNVILKWFERLTLRKNIEIEDEYVSFEPEDRPQYFEWVVWRAFLSINCLSNKPYNSRQFKIDGNFKPINHAPAGVPDLIFEFNDFILIVEVTFTASSRQVACEGVPVRHHVAEHTRKSTKPTYCLFIAPKIDINTLDEYKNKDYYIMENDHKQKVEIIPVRLDKFIEFYRRIPKADDNNPKLIECIMKNCRSKINLDNRDWEKYIHSQFNIPNSYTI